MAKKAKKPLRHRAYTNAGYWWGAMVEMTDDQSPRTKAILAAAWVENYLVLAIISRLRPLSEEDQKLLFEADHAALGDFSAKIDIGFALNLYGPNVKDDLHRMRKIRNKFAHLADVWFFNHPEVSRYCDELFGADLVKPRKIHKGPRTREDRYLDVANYFIDRFKLDQEQTYEPPASTNVISPDY
jgi:hypothetical protein